MSDEELRRQAMNARQYLGLSRGAFGVAVLVGVVVRIARHSPAAGIVTGVVCALLFAFTAIVFIISGRPHQVSRPTRAGPYGMPS